MSSLKPFKEGLEAQKGRKKFELSGTFLTYCKELFDIPHIRFSRIKLTMTGGIANIRSYDEIVRYSQHKGLEYIVFEGTYAEIPFEIELNYFGNSMVIKSERKEVVAALAEEL